MKDTVKGLTSHNRKTNMRLLLHPMQSELSRGRHNAPHMKRYHKHETQTKKEEKATRNKTETNKKMIKYL